VTKLVYPVATLPVSEVLSLFFVHLMLMGITIAIFLISGFGLSVYFLQLPYYIACTFVFTVVMSTMLSALTAISSDILHGVKSAMTFLFWLSPVLWTTDSLSGIQLTIVKANPIAYLLSGYRDSFVTRHWFFEDMRYALYFWALMAVLALLASFIFSRLEPEFADVL
jgi:teichoic acid transport system permease protein